jgi:hypothetical protein
MLILKEPVWQPYCYETGWLKSIRARPVYCGKARNSVTIFKFKSLFRIKCNTKFVAYHIDKSGLQVNNSLMSLLACSIPTESKVKKRFGSILEILTEAFFAWKRLDACRNAERNESFTYQNTFIAKITEWMNYKSWIIWVTKWSCQILGTFRFALRGLLAIRVYIHRCTAKVVDATPGSLAAPDVSAMRRSHNFLIRSADVVLGLFNSLDSALFARDLYDCFRLISLLYLGFIVRFVVFVNF